MSDTSTLSGERVSKNSPLIHLVGTLDELNSWLGLIKTKMPDNDDKQFLETAQVNLIKLMSHVSDISNGKYLFTGSETSDLEKETDRLKEMLPKQNKFILPGKSETEAFIHIARTVARRAERYFAAVSEDQHAASFLNKLSDYLFILSQTPV